MPTYKVTKHITTTGTFDAPSDINAEVLFQDEMIKEGAGRSGQLDTEIRYEINEMITPDPVEGQ